MEAVTANQVNPSIQFLELKILHPKDEDFIYNGANAHTHTHTYTHQSLYSGKPQQLRVNTKAYEPITCEQLI